jgi:hypothetical protein
MTEKALEAVERERIRTYAECAASHLQQIADIVLGSLGQVQTDAARDRIAVTRIGRGPAQADVTGARQEFVVPEVVVFEDENGNCLGMYIDPPGICTDEC